MRRTLGIVVVLLVATTVAGAAEKSGTITTSDGIKIHYIEAGQGPAILFIPGWTMPAEVWRPQIDYFAQHYHVVAVDPRSQGDSDKPADGNYPERRAKDYKELVDQLKLSPVVLVGWSMGVAEVLSYVDQFGNDSVRALVLVDGLIGMDPSPDFYKMMYGFLKTEQMERREATGRFVRSMYKKPQSEAYFEKLISSALKTPTNTAVTLTFNMLGVDYRPTLPKVQRPIYYALTTQGQQMFGGSLTPPPNMKTEVYEDAAHALFVDDVERFNKTVDEFIKAAK